MNGLGPIFRAGWEQTPSIRCVLPIALKGGRQRRSCGASHGVYKSDADYFVYRDFCTLGAGPNEPIKNVIPENLNQN